MVFFQKLRKIFITYSVARIDYTPSEGFSEGVRLIYARGLLPLVVFSEAAHSLLVLSGVYVRVVNGLCVLRVPEDRLNHW